MSLTSVGSRTITDPANDPIIGVKVIARLRPVEAAIRVDDETELLGYATTTTNSSGYYEFTLERNGNITPANTYWEIEEQVPRNKGGTQVWAIVVGASDFDISQAGIITVPEFFPDVALTVEAGDLRYLGIGELSPYAGQFVALDGYLLDNTGATNVTTLLNAGMSALSVGGGGRYRLPEGTFLCTPSIPSYVILEGDGPGTTIKMPDNTNDHTVLTDINAVECGIDMLTIDGNGDNQSGNPIAYEGFLARGASKLYVGRIWVKNTTGDAVELNGVRGATVGEIIADNIGRNVLSCSVNGSTETDGVAVGKIYGKASTTLGVPNAGIDLEPAKNISIASAVVDGFAYNVAMVGELGKPCRNISIGSLVGLNATLRGIVMDASAGEVDRISIGSYADNNPSAISKYQVIGTPTRIQIPGYDLLGFPSTQWPLIFTGYQSLAIANLAVYNRLVTGGVCSNIIIKVGVSAGNISVAAYNNGGEGRVNSPATRLATSGSIACPAAGDATISLGATIYPNIGDWFGLSASSVTATFAAGGSGVALSLLGYGTQWYQTAAHPLPVGPPVVTDGSIGASILMVGS